MHRDDIILVIVGVILAAAMIITFLLGGEKSRHGVGFDSKEIFEQKLLS